ncbi:MAG: hypothetical protein H7Y01_08490 [Ferruginibacter sp.]|nr:hypothetical protein [Chitinophagaceae bacterium]
MQQVNLHQQKLFALIIALVAIISLILTWSAKKVAGIESQSGFASWGFLSLIGIVGVVVATFMADKMRAYEGITKQIALASFAVVSVGAIVYLIRIMTGSQTINGYIYKNNDLVKPGIGLFICLIAGLAGIALVSGILSKLGTGTMSTSTPSAPFSPSATPPPPTFSQSGPPPPPPPPSA